VGGSGLCSRCETHRTITPLGRPGRDSGAVTGSPVLDTLPEEDDPLGVSTFVLECVHISRDTPEWVRTNIGATRALDGRQQAEWDHYRAEWSYHPNSGLNLVIRMA